MDHDFVSVGSRFCVKMVLIVKENFKSKTVILDVFGKVDRCEKLYAVKKFN